MQVCEILYGNLFLFVHTGSQVLFNISLCPLKLFNLVKIALICLIEGSKLIDTKRGGTTRVIAMTLIPHHFSDILATVCSTGCHSFKCCHQNVVILTKEPNVFFKLPDSFILIVFVAFVWFCSPGGGTS